jgi:glutamate racemase
MYRKMIYLFLISICWFNVITMVGQNHPDLTTLFNKEEITLVITDSGLGGLTVMEDISIKMKKSGFFKKVNLLFVNALFDENTGYNSLQTKKEKTDMFDKVLTAIDNKYNPDAILIGCNTLSVLYGDTYFSGHTKTPVIGIVEVGVELISEKLKADPSSMVIIFGTETTIEENSHRNGLLKQSISGERIVTKACPQLQAYIEQNPLSEETEMLISVYMNEALDELDNNGERVYISLNCSHFGYSEELWEKALQETSYSYGGILNPNAFMGAFLTQEKLRNRYGETKISFLVVSKVKLLNADPISGYFLENAPEIADALKRYTLIPDLF